MSGSSISGGIGFAGPASEQPNQRI